MRSWRRKGEWKDAGGRRVQLMSSVNITPDGKEALLKLSRGDMRRALNVLQVRSGLNIPRRVGTDGRRVTPHTKPSTRQQCTTAPATRIRPIYSAWSRA